MRFKIKIARKTWKRAVVQTVMETHDSWEAVEKLVAKFNSEPDYHVFCKEVTDVANKFTRCYDYRTFVPNPPQLRAKPKVSLGNAFTSVYVIPKVLED